MGHVTYSQLTLRRGMTTNFDLWRWFEKVASRDGGGVRATAEVAMLASDGTEQARFLLSGCLPVRLKAASLNRKRSARGGRNANRIREREPEAAWRRRRAGHLRRPECRRIGEGFGLCLRFTGRFRGRRILDRITYAAATSTRESRTYGDLAQPGRR